ncbi:hypothetical protein [Nitrosophilus kaiyonis]|uniref:hypothetical protein n=1 Tax=Nitrosophilus kaiyonis TaxID=2930200 RepID=UPI002492EBEC|nr:hypothetical protein [Nitrosophilus kaiyonis]
MKKIFFVIFLFSCTVFAAEHIAKVEPFEIYSIKSAVSGKVVKSLIDLEGKSVKNKEIIKIDSYIDEKTLIDLQNKLKNLEDILKIEKESLKNLKKLNEIKKDNYNRIKNLKTKSKFEKDLKLSDYLNTYNLYLSQKEKIKNLQIQIDDIKLNIEKTKDILDKKSIKIDGYIYKIYVKRGDFVNFGSPLVDVADISKAKVVIYLDKDEMKNIENKKIYINGKKTDLKFYKLFKISDPIHISAYRAEILLNRPKLFSKLIKVEIK